VAPTGKKRANESHAAKFIVPGIGAAVAQAMLDNDVNAEQVAKAMGIDASYISGVVNGTMNPSVERLLRMADAIGTTASRILKGIRLPARDPVPLAPEPVQPHH